MSRYKVLEMKSNNPAIYFEADSDVLAIDQAEQLTHQFALECNKSGKVNVYRFNTTTAKNSCGQNCIECQRWLNVTVPIMNHPTMAVYLMKAYKPAKGIERKPMRLQLRKRRYEK